jgi:hypothetical protein
VARDSAGELSFLANLRLLDTCCDRTGWGPNRAVATPAVAPTPAATLYALGRIADDGRRQLVEFLRTGGATIIDPDPAGTRYAGNVFEVPISPTTLDEIEADPGF